MSDTYVRLTEVGARDGLQNEKAVITVEQRLTFLEHLVECGFPAIEVGACVSPKWVPQMAHSDELYQRLAKPEGIDFSLLTPNQKGFEAAVAVQCKEVSIFTAASESFVQKNINSTIEDSLARFADIAAQAKEMGIKVRGYVSTIVDCPYDGPTDPAKVAYVAKKLYDMGCYEVSLGDTIGTGTPTRISTLLEHCMDVIPVQALAGHYHDTYGMAIANIYASVEKGLRSFDASVAGLGGCPYAKGASGNVATEDVVYLLEGLGLETGINKEAMLRAGQYISQVLGRANQSRFVQAACGV